MYVPRIQGVIDRRILLNYRVDPDVLAAQLPRPFRPQLVGGYGVAGVCLIRLRGIRPWFLPEACGIASENAAHRIAVEWDEEGEMRAGVFVVRRDTSSRMNAWAGGRLFPGVHHHARFEVAEGGPRYRVKLASDDGAVSIDVEARETERLPSTSLFASLADASAFFERGSLGYSPAAAPGSFDGLELNVSRWKATPLAVDSARSTYFDDRNAFPAGSIALDSALLMQDIEHSWQARPAICV